MTIDHTAATTHRETDAFVANDYETVTVPDTHAPLFQDTYRGFGWEVERGEVAGLARAVIPWGGAGVGSVLLRMRRPREIRNRRLVQELQRKAEVSLRNIVRLERSIGASAASVAIGFGIVGAGLLAGSVFSMDGGISVLSIVLGVIGLASWLGGFLGHGIVTRRRSAAIAPLVDRERTVIADAADQASRLLR